VEGVQQIFDGKEDDDGGDGGEDPGNDEEDDLLQDDLEDPNKRPQDASGSEKREMMEEMPHQNQRKVVDRVDRRSFMPKQFTQQESQ
jgi:hypothetical protein